VKGYRRAGSPDREECFISGRWPPRFTLRFCDHRLRQEDDAAQAAIKSLMKLFSALSTIALRNRALTTRPRHPLRY
jgi:hypothetical protein